MDPKATTDSFIISLSNKDVAPRCGAAVTNLYVNRCLQVQDTFSITAPDETWGLVRLFCGDLYGGMLARLDGETASQLMNCWYDAEGCVRGGPRCHQQND